MSTTFHYDEASQTAIADDGSAYVNPLAVNKDRTVAFCLRWNNKRIGFRATQKKKETGHQTTIQWIIHSIGSPVREIEAYNCSSRDEFREVAALVVGALSVISINLFDHTTPRIEAGLSDQLTELLTRFAP